MMYLFRDYTETFAENAVMLKPTENSGLTVFFAFYNSHTPFVLREQ